MAVSVTRRVERAAVIVDVSAVGDGGAEYLEYIVKSHSGAANFVLIDTRSIPQNRLLSSNFAEIEPGVWRRVWPLPQDPIAIDSRHNVVFQFARTQKYTYQVTLVNGEERTAVVDIDVEADDRADFFPQRLRVSLL